MDKDSDTKLKERSSKSLSISKDLDLHVNKLKVDGKLTFRRNTLKLEEHTKIFASMCPDEILDYYDDYETRAYNTTLMIGDVSDLTEKYTKSGKGGPSKLTETLNNYIGAMVQEILSHKGDVLKFSGDAFIVMWKLQDNMVMRDIAVEAIRTACVIQKYFGTLETDVDVTLKVKLAIASGKTYFTSIGDPKNMSHYIITGKPVWDVKYAEGLCRGGDILVTPSCWRLVNPNEYVYEILPDGKHTLILTTTVMWDQTKNNLNEKEGSIEQINDNKSAHSVKSFDSLSLMRGSTFMDFAKQFFKEEHFEEVDYSLRPKVIKASKAHLKEALKSYMLRPVVRAVEMGEPVHYLTEMRQVVIVFVNVITTNLDRNSLIRLVDEAYKLICKVVSTMQGCVNKTSLFDKDLMFLCIFGLRGDRHNLESQIGLRCATKIRSDLIKMNSIKSVSIGVTTGVTYCGVVGHILRREYTVIGMPVNKAARLMCTHTNRVVCDRESFLQSHLDARHFILQEPKALKGITNVGPVYEFLEQTQYAGPDLIMSKYPLLGRDAELKIFRRMLHNMLETRKMRKQKKETRSVYNTLFIKSEPRMGKTRFLDELTLLIPKNVPFNYISLMSRDYQEPYSLIRLIFCVPLGFVTSSTFKERQDKLTAHLSKYHPTEHLCALNQVFNVSFHVSSQYASMSSRDKQRLLRSILVRLMYSCFRLFWVIIVDDAEYTDRISLSLLDLLARQDLVLFVMSFGQKRMIDYELLTIIRKRAQVIHLMGLDKWYHAGFACQILNVEAIPAEVEKIIQEKSLGNPGWIESYLVSLVQVEGIVIQNVTEEESNKMGLVVPPSSMLHRSVNTRDENEFTRSKSRTDRWDMYETSYRDSRIKITDYEKLYYSDDEDDHAQTISVCVISPNFTLEDFDTEATVDVIILRIFDTLSLTEQFLLKCASVLGEIINRNILEVLMHGTTARNIAIAVKKLFELGILGCTVGDFNRNTGPITIYGSRHPSLDNNLQCGCIGITVPEYLSDLPKYASCGLMRFKTSVFRQTIYKLLTEVQKLEFHNKALSYLQRNVKRCAACGERPFHTLLGETSISADEGKQKLWRPIDLTTGSLISINYSEKPGQSSSRNRITSFDTVEIPNKRSVCSFSQMDFTNCECNLILITAYTQILEHCLSIQRSNFGLTAILEFVEVCLSTCNVLQARKLLKDGEEMLNQMYDLYEDNNNIMLSCIKGKIQTLQGRCYLQNGLLNEALRHFQNAMRTLNYHFPSVRVIIRLKSAILFEEQKLILACFKRCRINVIEDDNYMKYYNVLATCLAQMFIVFRRRNMKNHACLAAIWGFNTAMTWSREFLIICTAHANMIIALAIYDCRHRSMERKLEENAINMCYWKKNDLELQEVKAIAELYFCIFLSRWFRGLTLEATNIGFIAARLARTVRSVTLQLNILQGLVHLLMIECRYSEVVTMLRELEFIAYEDVDKSGRVWYYALCVDVLLEAGIAVTPIQKCEQFYREERHALINMRDPEAKRRYFTCMWLWNVRIREWEAAEEWKNTLTDVEADIKENSVVIAITALKKMEALLIFYVHKANCRNVKAMNFILVEIKALFKSIRNMKKVSKVIYARYLLMKAYYEMTNYHNKSGFKLLRKAKTVAKSTNNKMIYGWANHCEKAWSNSVSQIHYDVWTERCTTGTPINWHDIDKNDALIFPYTLPLPKNVQVVL